MFFCITYLLLVSESGKNDFNGLCNPNYIRPIVANSWIPVDIMPYITTHSEITIKTITGTFKIRPYAFMIYTGSPFNRSIIPI